MTRTTISVQRRLNEHEQKLNALQTSQEENATEIHGIKEHTIHVWHEFVKRARKTKTFDLHTAFEINTRIDEI